MTLVRAQEISQHLRSGKSPSILLVPGGPARLKGKALGNAGLAAIRAFVEGGGNYLGFCGGAGLGLSGDGSLGLCSWERDRIRDRLQHLVSGHMRVALPPLPSGASGISGALGTSGARSDGERLVPKEFASKFIGEEPVGAVKLLSPALPVWWPGRFCMPEKPEKSGKSGKTESVTVLASYVSAAHDFQVADLPLDSLPPHTLESWERDYGIRIGTDFMRGQPCIIHGRKGQGSYTLSYSHLETPDSPDANLWLAHLLRELGGLEPHKNSLGNWSLAPWDVSTMSPLWQDKLLLQALEVVEGLFTLGREHGLFYSRSSWLLGWRSGLPGASLNNLRIGLRVLVASEPSNKLQDLWKALRPGFAEKLNAFREGVTHLLLAERLAATLAKTAPEAISLAELQARRLELFGPPMEGGGLYQELWNILDSLLSQMWSK